MLKRQGIALDRSTLSTWVEFIQDGDRITTAPKPGPS
jgi:hypothetical protein